MKISVIVPAFNEERLLPESLSRIRAAMQAVTDAGWASELIVCDNNSTDRTAEIARARNAGAACASGDWLLFVDADSYPDIGLFREVVDVIRQGRCVAGGATVRVDTSNLVARSVVAWWNATSRLAKWAAGSFIFCEAETFRRVGGFDEEWFAAEEIDLFRRFKQLARARGRTITILHRHPLLTSARKLHLYDRRELLPFMVKTLVSRGRNLRSADGCFAWYDGRR